MSMEESERLHLRAPEPADVDLMYLMENLPGMRADQECCAPVSRQQVWEYVQGYDADAFAAGELRLMAVVGDTVVGMADLTEVSRRNLRATVGIMVRPQYQHQGYARTMLQLLEHQARTLGLRQLVAYVATDNPASASLFASAGYTLVATLPLWARRSATHFTDVLLYLKPLP